MATPFFENIRHEIVSQLNAATSDIKVAMCWFTCKELFDVLCEKLDEKVKVSLIVLNDGINNKPDGVNFQKFIDNGGIFYFNDIETPVHNKYCIIDNSTLINGSYNWTYFAENKNYENITIFKGESIISNFIKDFERLCSKCKLVNNVAQDANINIQQVTIIENVKFASESDIILKSRKDIGSSQLYITNSLGECVHEDKFHVFIPKNTQVPIVKVDNLTTINDNQEICQTDIRFGENFRGSLNTQIGHFAVTDIPPLPKGRAGLITTFQHH